jgi:hypothetical protein
MRDEIHMYVMYKNKCERQILFFFKFIQMPPPVVFATNAESLYNLYDAVAEVLYCGTMYQLWLQTNLPMVPGLDRWQQVLLDRSSNFFQVEKLKLK